MTQERLEMPVKNIWEIVEKIKADRPVTGACCHCPGLMSKITRISKNTYNLSGNISAVELTEFMKPRALPNLLRKL
jgi:hypothetical protein